MPSKLKTDLIEAVEKELPTAVRVEFFSDASGWGYRLCAKDGSAVYESAGHADFDAAMSAAVADEASSGLSFQDPSFTQRPHARW